MNALQFLADENVAGVARWLRFLGFDTEVAQGWPDSQVASYAKETKRILVTRDVELATQYHDTPVILIETDALKEQLRTILSRLPEIDSCHWFSLCAECNHPLQRIERDELLTNPRVPEAIKSGDVADQCGWSCTICGRIYWKGSHYRRTYAFLQDLSRDIQKQPGYRSPCI